MDLENIMLREKVRERQILGDPTYMWNLRKPDSRETEEAGGWGVGE